MDFINELNTIVRGDKKTYGEEGVHVMMRTGFDCFDYLNGEAILRDSGEKYLNLGLDYGKLVTIIGKSGSGKTTFALQLATQMMQRYEESSMFIFDFEQGTNKERIRQITGISEEYYDKHITLKQKNIYTNTILKLVMQIKKLKMEHEEKLLVENKEGIKDDDGNLVKILPPTFIVVDSIATMMPEDQADEEEIKGQMTATGIAKVNTQLFKRIAMPCSSANIIVIFINHINAKIETTIVPTQAQVNYLSQNETLPGGNAPIYLTNTLIRITTSTKLEENKTYQIKGFETKITLVKSRSAESGRSVNMIYNQKEGFDNELSLLEYIKSCGKLKGAVTAFKLEGLEDHTFRLSNFKEKLSSDPELKEHFFKLGRELLEDSIRDSSKLKTIEVKENEEEIIKNSEKGEE